jgi:hypothetical protein
VQGPPYNYLKSLGVTQPIDPEQAADIDALVLARVKAEITSRAAHAPIKAPPRTHADANSGRHQTRQGTALERTRSVSQRSVQVGGGQLRRMDSGAFAKPSESC